MFKILLSRFSRFSRFHFRELFPPQHPRSSQKEVWEQRSREALGASEVLVEREPTPTPIQERYPLLNHSFFLDAGLGGSGGLPELQDLIVKMGGEIASSPEEATLHLKPTGSGCWIDENNYTKNVSVFEQGRFIGSASFWWTGRGYKGAPHSLVNQILRLLYQKAELAKMVEAEAH